jgi:hypothetical protein
MWYHFGVRRTPALILLALATALCTGCVRRTVIVTSTPSGALVYLNDREVGRTPVEVDITYYGRYDVRLVHDGYEPVQTFADANPPVWDMAGPDLLAEVAPLDLQSKIAWHFDLEPVDADPEQLAERARALRDTLSEED